MPRISTVVIPCCCPADISISLIPDNAVLPSDIAFFKVAYQSFSVCGSSSIFYLFGFEQPARYFRLCRPFSSPTRPVSCLASAVEVSTCICFIYWNVYPVCNLIAVSNLCSLPSMDPSSRPRTPSHQGSANCDFPCFSSFSRD